MKRKVLSWLGLAAAVGLIYLFSMPSYRHGEPSIAGRKAPDFALQLNGQPKRLADYRGKVVVLDFWASWCPPCVEETPSLNALQARIASRGGVVLGISQDDDDTAYARFLADQNVIFPTFLDPTKKIAATYGSSVFPETYLISRDGKIARKVVGPQDWDNPELVAALDTLLDSK
jgi:cytochrome c biogenesis protein CcmG/thiol:disulfide interchange protein DsbE